MGKERLFMVALVGATALWGQWSNSLVLKQIEVLKKDPRSGLRRSNIDDDTGGCPSVLKGPGVPTFKSRNDLGSIMESLNFTHGVELGVQNGHYSEVMLKAWKNNKEYHLVDLWAPLDNYADVANVDQDEQNHRFLGTMERVSPWKGKVQVCRNFTTYCVTQYQDDYFDFVYVDARHDYKGVHVDLVDWWPKLKVGGIMAGHDYVTQDDGPAQSGQSWTVNYDGTEDLTGTVVKGAVDAFAGSVCRQVTVSYRERLWNSWAIRK